MNQFKVSITAESITEILIFRGKKIKKTYRDNGFGFELQGTYGWSYEFLPQNLIDAINSNDIYAIKLALEYWGDLNKF